MAGEIPPQHTPQTPIIMIYNPVCGDESASGKFPASMSACQGAVSTDTDWSGWCTRAEHLLEKGRSEVLSKVPLEVASYNSSSCCCFTCLCTTLWTLMTAQNLKVCKLYTLGAMGAEECLERWWKARLHKKVKSELLLDLTLVAAHHVLFLYCYNIVESKPFKPKLRGCSCTGQ